MTFMLNSAGEPEDLPAAEQRPTRWPDAVQASVDAARLEMDSWWRSDRVRSEILQRVGEELGPDDQPPPKFPLGSNEGGGWETKRLLERVAEARAQDPAAYPGLPASQEELTEQVNAPLRAEYQEAQEILGNQMAGSWSAGFVGQLWAGATDESTLMTLPFGAGAGGLGKIALTEFALGAGAEALTLPRQFNMADRLEIEKPNIAGQLLTGGAINAGLATVLSGTARVLEYSMLKDRSISERRPEGTGAIAHRKQADAEYARLSGGGENLSFGEEAGMAPPPAPQAAGSAPAEPATAGTGAPLKMGDFDFSDQGNASAKSNRVGYVFGKLLSLGYEPHIASALVGNIIQESGAGINTRAVGDGGNAFGMAQWNGPRRRAYLEFARKKGKDAGDIDTQIEFLHYELNGPEAAAGARIRAATDARTAARIASEAFWRPGIPHLSRRMANAERVAQQYSEGVVPRWTGPIANVADEGPTTYTGYSSRGYTSSGQVVVGDDLRIDVEYEVVDAASLRQASGNLQPRDRGRIASDAWVADTASRLDPAQLMPSPTADRGTPIVGPDGVIESGNGRVRAIQRAYETHPDRASAYRQQIEMQTGKDIPEGISQPVLIGRRTSDLSDTARRKMVVDAQDSGVARLNASERAAIGSRALTADLMQRYAPGKKFSSAENRDFARLFAGSFPRSERNAFIDSSGSISIDGVRQLDDAMFARAYDAPDIVARYVETEAGEMRSLMDALADAAPDMALLRAEIDAGLLRPEMDITPYVLDAARMIMAARDLATIEGGAAARILNDMLEDVDLFGDSVAPLTRALVRHFMPGGKQASAPKITAFLRRYVEEARKSGRTGDALEDLPGPLDVLKAIDRSAFGDIEEAGAARLVEKPEPIVELDAMPENAFASGATSPEAQAGDVLALDQLRQRDEAPENVAEVSELARSQDAAFRANAQALPEDLTFELPGTGGQTITLREYLDDLDADELAEAVIDACTLKGKI